MRILITALFDDNFGDMIIRTCFTQLLKVAMENLGNTDYELDVISLKEYDEKKIADADVMFFPGGGLFGLSYLNFSESLEKVMEIAENNNTKVVFSSLGSNNMDATEEDTERLKEFFRRKCIKAVSVRENPDMFRYYAEDVPFDIDKVCDPGVWAGVVYGNNSDARKQKEQGKQIVGINFVRGGLFKDNGVDHTQREEEKLLYDLMSCLEEKGISCRIFTNGSVLDCAALLRFVNNYDLEADKYILCDTTREVVDTIAQFDAVVAVRMHSSIISYSLDVPSFNLVWNPKIPFFYESIGYPERLVMPDEWDVEKLTGMTTEILDDKEYKKDPEYLMSLYRSLFKTLGDVVGKNSNKKVYSYKTVCDRLSEMEMPHEEDLLDMHFKILKAEKQYNYAKKAKDDLNAELRNVNRELRRQTRMNEKLSRDKERLSEKYAITRSERNAYKRRLDRIDKKLPVKLYHKVKGIVKRRKGSNK